MSDQNNADDNIITGFGLQDLDQIVNGPLNEIFKSDILFGKTGKVVNKNTNQIMSDEITPMIMLINQSRKGFIDRLRKYVNGSDPRFSQEFERKINYYNREISVKDIAINFRNY